MKKLLNQNYLGDVVLDSCDKKSSLPNLVFEIKGENDKIIELTLTPDDYVLQFNIDGKVSVNL